MTYTPNYPSFDWVAYAQRKLDVLAQSHVLLNHIRDNGRASVEQLHRVSGLLSDLIEECRKATRGEKQ